MDLAHHLFTLTFDGKLGLAPIPPDLSSALDVGTGTGLWAIDFADQYPSASVIGTDLSPIQPHWLPPNLRFEVDDCEAEWTFGEGRFDYIHVRSLFGAICDWPRFYAQAMRALKPGGYLEHAEFAPGAGSDDGTVNENNAAGNWQNEAIESAKVTGRTFEIMYRMCGLVREAGYQDVVEKKYKWPLGPWPKDKKLKELGWWAQRHVDAGLENWCLALLTRVFGWSYSQVMEHVAKVRANLWDKKIHAWHEMRVVYGRKPYV